MKAILRTYTKPKDETAFEDQFVEVDADHDFPGGPYQDTVPFSVGSNQSLQPWDGITRPKGMREDNDWFFARYLPVHHKNTGTGELAVLKTFGTDLDTVKATDPKKVWTLVGESPNLHVVAGMQPDNAINYITTKEPWETGKENFCW